MDEQAAQPSSLSRFASTFFDNPNDVHYIKYAKGKDPLLRCYDVCDRYLADVKHNPNASADLKVYGEYESNECESS
ncbi:hypothetical protein PC112_g16292 [Phytophthora cactorum]|nr:hypothetical protein PC112_g16292 [Phytophthora cactorum]